MDSLPTYRRVNALALGMLTTFIVSVFLLNLLIGVMTHTIDLACFS